MSRADSRGARRDGSTRRLWRAPLLALVALAAGAVAGVLVLAPALQGLVGGGAAGVSLGQTEVSEDELDRVLGAYTYGGQRMEVSVRDAILQESSLGAMRNADGTYEVPSVDTVLAAARNAILVQDAEARGISATDDDARAYAQDVYGTRDMALLAASFGMDQDTVAEQMCQAALLRKLRDEVVETSVEACPEAPAPPEAGLEDVPSPDYANYVVALAGDEWDAASNAWAGEDGEYREALRDYTVSNEAATYSAAQAAYEVARARCAAQERKVAAEWTKYANGLLSQATVELFSLVA